MMLINDHYLPQNKIKCCLTLPSDVRCALRTTTQCHFSLVKLANDYYCYARSKKRKKNISGMRTLWKQIAKIKMPLTCYVSNIMLRTFFPRTFLGKYSLTISLSLRLGSSQSNFLLVDSNHFFHLKTS